MHVGTGQPIMREHPSDASDLLRSTLPFRLVRSEGKIVGCWYTSDPCPAPRDASSGSAPLTSVVYRGMARTADDRVAGMIGSTLLTRDLPDRMLRMLREATWSVSIEDRKCSSHAFVDGISDAALRVRAASDCVHIEGDARMPPGRDGRPWSYDDEDAMHASARFDLERARCISLFLDTLDPAMVGALRPHRWSMRGAQRTDVMIGEAWPLLDRTFGMDAPLQAKFMAALDDHRCLGRLLRPHCHKAYDYMSSPAGMSNVLRILRASPLSQESPFNPERVVPRGPGPG